jgi:major membrane immunogen (membrane-anchored lipoprotein)
VNIIDSKQAGEFFHKRGQRLASDEHINDAREAADNARRQRQQNLRTFADALIDEIEDTILGRASAAGLSNPAEFLEYVELMLSNRVIERRLAP